MQKLSKAHSENVERLPVQQTLDCSSPMAQLSHFGEHGQHHMCPPALPSLNLPVTPPANWSIPYTDRDRSSSPYPKYERMLDSLRRQYQSIRNQPENHPSCKLVDQRHFIHRKEKSAASCSGKVQLLPPNVRLQPTCSSKSSKKGNKSPCEHPTPSNKGALLQPDLHEIMSQTSGRLTLALLPPGVLYDGAAGSPTCSPTCSSPSNVRSPASTTPSTFSSLSDYSPVGDWSPAEGCTPRRHDLTPVISPGWEPVDQSAFNIRLHLPLDELARCVGPSVDTCRTDTCRTDISIAEELPEPPPPIRLLGRRSAVPGEAGTRDRWLSLSLLRMKQAHG